MTKASDNEFPSVLFGELGAAPTTPATGKWRLYTKSTGLFIVDDAGAETGPFGAAGSGIAATIFDAKGDLIAASAADTAARLAAGANNTILMADSAEATGLKWFAPNDFDAPASGDTTMVNANTPYDAAGVSNSCVAGTWLFWWKCTVQIIVATAQSYELTARLWDGTTTYDEATFDLLSSAGNNNTSRTINGHARVVLGSTTTVKVSALCSRGSSASKIARNPQNNSAASNSATRLSGIRIA